MKTALIAIAAFILAAGRISAAGTDAPSLKAYGPGGPLEPMKECAALFEKERNVKVEVVAGPEAKWIDQAKQDADLIFGGAEYMLTEFAQKHAGLLDESTRTSLYQRRAGILVRKGNPKKIAAMTDLARPGIRLVDANGAGQLGLWEDLAGRSGLIAAIQKNIAISVPTSADAIEKWKAMPELDAWITFASWHNRLTDVSDLVRLSESDTLLRGTPVAISAKSTHKDLAQAFIEFLKTDRCHAVFKKWGWE